MADASSGDQDQESQCPGYNGYGQWQVSDHSHDAHAVFCPTDRKYAPAGQPPSANAALDRLREAAVAHDEN